MELGIRDWMIIVGILLLLAVLVDGYRRVRNDRRHRIRMSLAKNIPGGDSDDLPNPELPNGGARVVGRRMGDIPPPPRDEDVDLDRSVPVLMELESAAQEATAAEPAQEAMADSPPEPPATEPSADEPPREPQQLDVLLDSEPESVPQEQGGTQEVLVIHAVARDDAGFNGHDLLQILLACDMRFGKMNIFHRHEQAGGRGAVQFSAANMVEPGTFDLDNIDDFSTPGVSFFLTLPGPEDSVQAFDYMVETAQCLAKNLGAELRDESHSVVTPQTLEHDRQRIREFERRRLAQHA